MAISGQQTILIGLPNESANSDSLYTAFTKINDNFDITFSCASPYNNFVAGNGISVNSNVNTSTVTITNTGVTSLTAGTNITLSGSNGNITISSNGGGGGGGGTVTSIGIIGATGRLNVSPSDPIVSSGNFLIDLAVSSVTAGTYNNPTFTVDTYGRVTSAANGMSVTSVGLTPGTGIQIAGGPITTSGNITVTNTGVTRINAGSGISVNGSNGNVTISTTSNGGTVTSLGISSSSLTITGSPITTSGIITVNLPSTFAGTLTTNAQPNITSVGTLSNLTVSGNISGNNIQGTFYPLSGSANGIIFTANPGGGTGDQANIKYYATAGEATVLDFTVTNDADDIIRFNATGGTQVTGNLSISGITSSAKLNLTGSEDLASGAAANLQVTASYFTTTAAETATLAAGTNGQIKTFMMVADGGDMVITVTNSGWAGAGTMTFSAVGQGCTLQYVNSKWFCIGNNGVTFA